MEYSPYTASVLDYIKEQYGAEPEFLWKDDQRNAAIRCAANRKWFAVLMLGLPKKTLKLPEEGTADILDLKCDPLLLGSLLDGKSVLPAYHMNKEHWFSLLLDGSVPLSDVHAMIDMSYALVCRKKR